MVDHLSPEGRSRVMAAIRSTNTGPERALRAALRATGASGYRIHYRSLPGKPDVAFTRWKVAVFVDGAFWHGHPDHFNPETASEYWREKIKRNQERDRQADEALRALGWTVLRFWDFELRDDPGGVIERVLAALGAAGWRKPPAAG
ncbi:DNA glycosylase [Carbonactinospora thermoautotrophica]|uniref:DNA glycosylase n=1 Tax=Carbonactinospora thermoautotrophica TaxID=1469144 RepID=A0A132MJA8_9ACTN|nr:very short patch repair endonuclease [Carbonactinospora thermoautotrophica]KWW97916.1 DNA glycosylase [Carbonactinospora thermoautotrophica]KWX07654.1 DNA glycosylase [Carbonactinospora thermoautotrophica]